MNNFNDDGIIFTPIRNGQIGRNANIRRESVGNTNFRSNTNSIPRQQIRTSGVRNLKVNKKTKGILIKGIALITAGTIAVGGLIAIFKKNHAENLQRDKYTISSYYGNESSEAMLIKYLDLAMQFDNLDLDCYASNGTLEKIGLDQHLCSPEEIEAELQKFKNLKDIDSSNLDELYDYLHNVAFLKSQDKFISSYISGSAYQMVYKEFVSSLKEYAAEKYNLEDPNKIIFRYYEEAGDIIVVITYPQQYVGEYKTVVDDKKIVKGVTYMVKLQNLFKKSPSNEKLMDEYVETLIRSIDLKEEVRDKDLYSEKAEERLKGR